MAIDQRTFMNSILGSSSKYNYISTQLHQHKNDCTINTLMINLECIVTAQTDRSQETILTTISASTSLSMQRRHSMECAIHQQLST